MTEVKYEEHKLYNDEVIIRYWDGNHQYRVWDEKNKLANRIVSGATGYTGVLDKGKGLQMWPMWEMSKYIQALLSTITVKEFMDGSYNLEKILQEGRDAHAKKGERGKDVGTDAHAWVEQWLTALQKEQAGAPKKEVIYPQVPTVEELAKQLKTSYIATFKRIKPHELDDFKKLLKVLDEDFVLRERMYTQAAMTIKSIEGFLKYTERVKITVYGVEQVIYSRKYIYSGKFDSVLGIVDKEQKIDGVFLTDFKTSNESTNNPKGVYAEYLAQCGLYDNAYSEEKRPQWDKIKGHLILNGSKNTGGFYTHYSTTRQENIDWGLSLVPAKEGLYKANKQVKESV